MKKLVFLFSVVLLVGCTATGPIFTPVNSVAADKALVYVYNPMRNMNGNEPNYLYINGSKVFMFKFKGYTYFNAVPGIYTFSRKLSTMFIATNEKGKSEFKFDPGKTYFVRYVEIPAGYESWSSGTSAGSVALFEPWFELIEEERALKEIAKTKYIPVGPNGIKLASRLF